MEFSTYFWIDPNDTEKLLIELNRKHVPVWWKFRECRRQIIFEVNICAPRFVLNKTQFSCTIQHKRNGSFECIANLIRWQIAQPILNAQTKIFRRFLHQLIVNALIKWWNQCFDLCIERFQNLATNRQQTNVPLNFMMISGRCNRIVEFLILFGKIQSKILGDCHVKNGMANIVCEFTYKFPYYFKTSNWFLTFTKHHFPINIEFILEKCNHFVGIYLIRCTKMTKKIKRIKKTRPSHVELNFNG